MEAEKVHQEKVARTIQQKQDGGGALQFVDNRMVNTLLQRVGLEDEEGFQMKTAQFSLMRKKIPCRVNLNLLFSVWKRCRGRANEIGYCIPTETE
jgi:hypothetical protein